jgi:hypothetical protein
MGVSVQPKQVIRKVVSRIQDFSISDILVRDPLAAACQRLSRDGHLRSYRKAYLAERNRLLSKVMSDIVAGGDLDANLKRPDFAQCDERVVEYPFIARELTKLAGSQTIECADLGCVLNNSLVKDLIAQKVSRMWFFNVSLERPQIHGRVVYVEDDLRCSDMAGRLQFPFVTCLSTLEHIGMDNTRYGGTPQEFDTPPNNPEEFAMSGVRKLKEFVALNGTLIISVPYGPFEYVRLTRDTSKVAYYAFDRTRLESLASCLENFDVELIVYKVVPGVGWVKTDLSDNTLLRLGQGIASSGGVGFIRAVRRS